MFIPVFIFHIIVTILILVGLVWAFSYNSNGWWDLDYLAPMKALGVLLLYACYWIVFLIFK